MTVAALAGGPGASVGAAVPFGRAPAAGAHGYDFDLGPALCRMSGSNRCLNVATDPPVPQRVRVGGGTFGRVRAACCGRRVPWQTWHCQTRLVFVCQGPPSAHVHIISLYCPSWCVAAATSAVQADSASDSAHWVGRNFFRVGALSCGISLPRGRAPSSGCPWPLSPWGGWPPLLSEGVSRAACNARPRIVGWQPRCVETSLKPRRSVWTTRACARAACCRRSAAERRWGGLGGLVLRSMARGRHKEGRVAGMGTEGGARERPLAPARNESSSQR